jgi:hypothetical protein
LLLVPPLPEGSSKAVVNTAGETALLAAGHVRAGNYVTLFLCALQRAVGAASNSVTGSCAATSQASVATVLCAVLVLES